MKSILIGTAVCLLAVLAIHQANAEPQTLIFGSSGLYSVHLAHVGDTIIITNNDTTNHTVTGKDSIGETIDSGTIQPGKAFQMSFMFPAQFSFYDKYHTGNIGIFYIYNPTEQLPQHVYNHTSTSDLSVVPQYYQGATPQNSTEIGTIPTLQQAQNTTHANATIVKSVPLQPDLTPVTNQTQTIQNNSTNDTVAYWKAQADMYKSKYEGLLAAIRLLLG